MQIKELLEKEYANFQIEKKTIKDRNFLMSYIDNINKQDLKFIVCLIFSSTSFYFSGGVIALGP